MSIQKLLKPKKVAVVGASEKEGFGGDTCRNILQIMDEGSFYFVNPKRDTVFGHTCYPNLDAIKDDIDLVIVCTPQKTVLPILKESLRKKAQAAVVFASGYSEVGNEQGKAAENELLAFCEENAYSVMGPNCAGFINYIDRVSSFAFISENRDRTGSVGFISQSGQLVLSTMDRPGTGFSYVISAGNANAVTMEAYLDFLVEDDQTRVIALYIEGIKNPAAFVQALDKASKKGKPVVILKVGKSAKAQAIAASHTGSMSGSDAVLSAVLKKYGAIRVDDLEELISTSQALSILPALPEGNGLTSISLSGGETAICADLGEEYAMHFPELQTETLQKLNELLPGYATPNNPLDITATLSYDTDKFAAALEALMKDPNIHMVSVGYTLLQEIADNAIAYMYEAMHRVSREAWCKPMVMLPFVEMTRNEPYVQKLKECGVPVLPTSRYAFKIIRHIIQFAGYRREALALPQVAKTQTPDHKERIALSEAESKRYLVQQGLKIDPFFVAATASEAAEQYTQLENSAEEKPLKVALKIDSRDILHKTEAGGVKLNIANIAEVKEGFETIIRNARAYNPNANINGVQIAPMLKPGVEVIIGVKNDPEFGPVILCGLGGILVELFKDVALRLAPVSKEEARDMVSELKAKALLEGYRGAEACDLDSLYELIQTVSEIAYAKRNELLELDMNPVFLSKDGASIADALVITSAEPTIT